MKTRYKTCAIRLDLRTALLFLLLINLTAAQAEPAPSARLLADNLRAKVDQSAGLAATFRQVNFWTMMDEADTATGSLILAPPYRFRLEYLIPEGHLVGCDGNYIWTFLPDDNQVLRSSWRHTTGWGDIFLKGLDSADDNPVRTITSSEGAEIAQLDLGPHPDWNLASLTVEIDLATGDPVSYSYTDEEGNQTRFDFLSVQYPKSFQPSDFEFHVPEHFEILDVD